MKPNLNPDPHSLLPRLNAELAAALGLDPAEIQPQSKLVDDLGAESIDLIDLTFRIEKTFGITVPEGELFEDPKHPARLLTVADVAAYIAAKLGPPGV
ncbi:MAG: acyl carrier protein [Candidatus Methylacidiphilales bacterium]|nr:acyl carrier protein [Candidatus Methylacidiphilales bacterium]